MKPRRIQLRENTPCTVRTRPITYKEFLRLKENDELDVRVEDGIELVVELSRRTSRTHASVRFSGIASDVFHWTAVRIPAFDREMIRELTDYDS
jgi:antitoxin component of MazEF toxin-antitoxin module